MATLDLTMNGLILPGLENFTPDFGTKNATNVGVSTADMCTDIMMAFAKQRPVTVSETSTTGNIESDRRISITASDIILTLGNPVFAGCKMEIVGGFSSGTANIIYSTSSSATATLVLKPNEVIVLTGNANNYFMLYQRIYDGEVENVSLARTNIQVDNSRYCIFDFSDSNHKSIKLLKHTHIPLDITVSGATERRWFDTGDTNVSYNLDSLITAAASATTTDTGIKNGRNFYVYLFAESTGGVGITVSCNSTYPSDISSSYTANNTRKIAQFHTLCVDAGSSLTARLSASVGAVTTANTYEVKGYDEDDDNGFYDFYNKQVTAVSTGTMFDTITVVHPLAGFSASDILPESIWCITFKPYGVAEGTVFDVNTNMAPDIYLQSGTGRNTASIYGATITDTRQPINHEDDMMKVRKMLPSDAEFISLASGSNEAKAIYGTADPVTTGGHNDTSGSRCISFIGCEDCCGVMWQWLREYGPTGGSSYATYDGQGTLGQTYGVPYQLRAGGSWNVGSSCGSRCRLTNDGRSYTSTNIGARGVSRVMRLAA